MALVSFGEPHQLFDSAVTSVASSAVEVTLLPENVKRFGATIYNDSTKILFVKFGTGVSTTSFTAKIPSAGYFEVPFTYAGIITGLWAAVNGAARITELLE